jgi:hypothetical protein
MWHHLDIRMTDKLFCYRLNFYLIFVVFYINSNSLVKTT